MDKQHFDFFETFTLDAVEARYKEIGYKPGRGYYVDDRNCGRTSHTACLLGSFEHALFGRSDRGFLAKDRTDSPHVLLRALEAGWENYSLETFLSFLDLWHETGGDFDDQDVVDAYELGQALGLTLVGPTPHDDAPMYPDTLRASFRELAGGRDIKNTGRVT